MLTAFTARPGKGAYNFPQTALLFRVGEQALYLQGRGQGSSRESVGWSFSRPLNYVLLGHLMVHRAALSYAAGEWAFLWPLGRLIGGMGAHFVRQLVEAERGVCRPVPGAEKILVHYANSAYH